jgi:hypothetical protein
VCAEGLCATMEQSNERTSFDNLNHARRESSSERSQHTEYVDEENFLLLDEKKESIRNGSWRDSWSWSTRVQTTVTIFNIILFSISVIILSASRGAKMLSEQDYWRATSYYCTSLLLPPPTHHPTNKHYSPSLRPPRHPQNHTHYKRYFLGHFTPLHLARPHRRRRRLRLGIRGQQHHAHRNFLP